MFSTSQSEMLAKLARKGLEIATLEKTLGIKVSAENKTVDKSLDSKFLPSHQTKYLQLEELNVLKKMLADLEQAKISVTALQADAKSIFPFLAPNISVKYHFEKKEFIKQTIPTHCKTLAEIKDFCPDVIFIFGNNDLIQVELAAKHFLALKNVGNKLPLIIVSGRGGHGTVSTPLFGFSEAETIRKRLIELGIPIDKIFTECNSRNTGQNIKFTESLIPCGARHIAISSTFSTLFRQLLSIYEQALYPWETVTILAPTWEEVSKHFFSTTKDILIHLIYMLREVATFLDYTINENNFITARILPNLEDLHCAMRIALKYFKFFTGSTAIPELFIGDFIAALMRKSVGEKLDSSAQKTLGKQVSEVANYFRTLFNILERQWFKQLPSTVNLWQQSALLDPAKVYSRLHLDPTRTSVEQTKMGQ